LVVLGMEGLVLSPTLEFLFKCVVLYLLLCSILCTFPVYFLFASLRLYASLLLTKNLIAA
jgi:hypothetical protein